MDFVNVGFALRTSFLSEYAIRIVAMGTNDTCIGRHKDKANCVQAPRRKHVVESALRIRVKKAANAMATRGQDQA